jgi:hypothetical protein
VIRPPKDYWAHTLFGDPRRRPKVEQPLRDLPPRASVRFRKVREGVRALKHVTEQVVFLGTTWKWVWMYEVGGRKLAYLHPMERGLSGTYVLTELEEGALMQTNGFPGIVRDAVRTGVRAEGILWCWMDLPDNTAVKAFVDVVRLKHELLARPE